MVSKYLAGTASFPINPPPIPVVVARYALNHVFGLTIMGLTWVSGDKKHHFLTPQLAVNPDMPSAPGAPGLLLSCREELWTQGPWDLFIKADTKKHVRLDYAGRYKAHLAGTMTADEFSAHKFSVSHLWVFLKLIQY